MGKRIIPNMKSNIFRGRPFLTVGVVFLTFFILIALFAPVLAPFGRDDIDLDNIEMAPSATHLLGTDELGRDVLSRLLYGAQVSLGVGFIATLLQVCFGVLMGSVSGYYGGWIDTAIMRVVDIIMCFPFFVIAISIAAILGPSARNVVIIITILQWTNIARIVRGEILVLRKKDFIESARALGLRPGEIIRKHILPNTFAPIIVYSTLGVANAILLEAGLSFLGMGVRQPQPSWGNMLSAAQSMSVLQSEWWLWIPPGLFVFLTVLSINFVGDGLREALDPKLSA
jgi:peptide/nickel transport system permease protein